MNFRGANLYKAKLVGANLRDASFHEADLRHADLSGADLTGANLQYARLVGTKLCGTKLSECRVYGVSAWDIDCDGTTEQSNLIITKYEQSTITVDNLKVAQFIYLILNNGEIRDVISTITSKAVLILGRFQPEDRKRALEGVRDRLRVHGYVPIVFDFTPSPNRDLTETVQVLANMARFVVADITDARSTPQELSHVVPNLPSVPIVPIRLACEAAYATFEHWTRFPWVLPEYVYKDNEELVANVEAKLIAAAEARLCK